MELARIFILEDNPADLYLVNEAIRGAIDCELTSFLDGEQILSAVRANGAAVPDLILMDVNVPKIGGADIVSAVRDEPRFAAVPIVALSSSSAPKDISSMIALGADYYVQKASDLDEFMKIGQFVKDALAKGRSRPSGQSGSEDEL